MFTIHKEVGLRLSARKPVKQPAAQIGNRYQGERQASIDSKAIKSRISSESSRLVKNSKKQFVG